MGILCNPRILDVFCLNKLVRDIDLARLVLGRQKEKVERVAFSALGLY